MRSSTEMRFDWGDGAQTSRLQVAMTYQGLTGSKTVELIIVGNQTWQRDAEDKWVRVDEADALAQPQSFLPHVSSATNVESSSDGKTTTLRWFDADRDADTTLEVAPSGVPQRLRQVGRSTGSVVTVRYSSWNAPVTISPPSAIHGTSG